MAPAHLMGNIVCVGMWSRPGVAGSSVCVGGIVLLVIHIVAGRTLQVS
jgi:hypothetical protein